MTATILIVDDEPGQLRMAEQAVAQKLHYRAIPLSHGKEAVAWIQAGRQPQPDLLLLDLGGDSLEVIRAVRDCRPQLPIIVLSLYGGDAQAREALAAGACDFLTKPVAIERLRLSLCNTLMLERMAHYIAYLEQRQAGHIGFSNLVGNSPAFTSAVVAARTVAASPLPVWITGESGCGKEFLARAMHGEARRGRPFIVVNGAVMEEEAQAVGVPAQEKLVASLYAAKDGSLFLRDIGALALSLQHRLLQAMAGIPARLVCSSSVDVTTLAAQGQLHPEWCQRFARPSIELPPLRDRRQDIPLLARHFVRRYAASERKHMYGVTADAGNCLMQESWPGNVRQLASLLWRAVMLCNQELLDAGNLRLAQQWQPAPYQRNAGEAAPSLVDGKGRIKSLRMIEEDAIRLALHQAGGSMTRAARSLGIGRSTLYRRVRELKIDGYISRENQTTRPMIDASPISRS